MPSLLPSAVEEAGIDTRRLSYPLNYWNAIGVWAAMTVSMALAWSAHAARWWMRGLALAAVCVAVPVAYMTYSRTAAIVTVVAALTVVALSRNRWLAALNVLVAAVGSALVIVVIRAHRDIADYTGTEGAVTVALVTAVVALGVHRRPRSPPERPESTDCDCRREPPGRGSSTALVALLIARVPGRARASPIAHGTASTGPRRRRRPPMRPAG